VKIPYAAICRLLLISANSAAIGQLYKSLENLNTFGFLPALRTAAKVQFMSKWDLGPCAPSKSVGV
jgi:hypothetical protein